MRLTPDSLKGMWAGLPVPWTEKDQIDEGALRENVRRTCRAGAHGVYTHGTTGEFYAQSSDEWESVARATVEESNALGTLNQVGCTALWTGEAIRRARFAANVGADGIQLAFPFWLPLTEDQAVRFLKEIHTAVPGIPLVIYNTDRAKCPLTLSLLKRVLDEGIPLVGCKGVGSGPPLEDLIKRAPTVRFFVGENELAELWKRGARGCYSSFIYACPKFMLRYFQLCETENPEAIRIGNRLKAFMSEFVEPRWNRGLFDTAFDRMFATMTGFLTGSLLRSRPPYESATLKDVEDCRAWFEQHLPEFLYEI